MLLLNGSLENVSQLCFGHYLGIGEGRDTNYYLYVLLANYLPN